MDAKNSTQLKTAGIEQLIAEERFGDDAYEAMEKRSGVQKCSRLKDDRWEPRRQEDIREKRHTQKLFGKSERLGAMLKAWGGAPKTDEEWQEEMAAKYMGGKPTPELSM